VYDLNMAIHIDHEHSCGIGKNNKGIRNKLVFGGDMNSEGGYRRW